MLRMLRTLTEAAEARISHIIRSVLRRIQITAGAYKKKKVTVKVLTAAVAAELSGELAKHAVSEGTKAVTKYTSNM